MNRHSSTAAGGDHRLFFALWPGDDVRAALANAVEAMPEFTTRGHRVPVDRYHLTLHFLGSATSRPDDLIDAAVNAAAGLDAKVFQLVVDRAGSFSRARVGWLAPSGNSGLDALWAGLAHALDAANLPLTSHETFAPHVTVLRNVKDVLQERSMEPLSWPVGEFVLVHSHGGRYEMVGRWALQNE